MAHFDAFVPALIRSRLAQGPDSVWQPSAETLNAAVLFADLSGFSILAERLAQRGSRGAEDLKDLLNAFFGPLVDTVHAHGGQVVSFPGDAVLAVWPLLGGDHDVGLLMAAGCGLVAQEAFARPVSVDATGLKMRVGVGCGDVWVAHVGGVADRWHLLVAGDALQQAVGALKAATPGDVLVSPEVWRRIAADATSGGMSDGFVRLRAVSVPALPGPVADALLRSEDRTLRRYVPRSIQMRIDAGQTDWLAEFRRLSVLFVNLGNLDLTGGDALDRLQRATVVVQTAVHRYGGNIGHLVADDKGTVIDCGWGVALHAHADDAVRAARAAVEIRQTLSSIGVRASFGLATGDVFTGLRGNRDRCDFAMIGTVVNFAAAMMQAGAGEIVCDTASCDAISSWAHVEPVAGVAVKGHDGQVEAYRVLDFSRSGPSEIIGRVGERKILEDRLEALRTAGSTSVVIVEGEAGIGKSRLLRATMDWAAARRVKVVRAHGDAIERSAPYHVWRGVLGHLIGLGPPGEASEQRLTALLESAPSLLPFAPLLNPVLGLSLDENERSRSVTPRGRGGLTRDLLVHLFRQTVGQQPLMLVLDDTQWFDSASWALVEGIEQAQPHVLLVIATRPVPREDAPPELARISAREGTSVLRLEALAAEETVRLVCQLLRARRLDRAVERLILQKAEGHPFFTEELAHTLRDRGLVRIDDGVCRFSGPAAADESVLLPSTVRVMVGSRIDQLTVAQQLTAKVASVFGRTFDVESLGAIYPVDLDRGELAEHVRALEARELIRAAPTASPQGYEFKHAIIQEVAYGLLPYAQRSPLHAAAARFYERRHASDLVRFYPLLATHWGRAGVKERTRFYCEKAGYDALERFANEEAVRLLQEALAIDAGAEGAAAPVPDVVLPRRVVSGAEARRAQLRRCLGEAYVNLGKWTEGWTQLADALGTVGYPLPDTTVAWTQGIASQVVTQVWHRVRRPVVQPWPEPVAELLMDTVRALQRIGNVSYATGRRRSLFYCLLAALNLAERLKPSLELATLYASAANILGLVPLHRIATSYVGRAMSLCGQLNDPAVEARIFGRTSVYRLSVGDWSACRDVERSMALSDTVGDPFQWEESAAVRARAAHLRGEFGLSVRLGAEIRARAVASRTAIHVIWGIDAEAWGLLYLGDHAKAQERSKQGLAMAMRDDRVSYIDLLGVSALVHLYRGELEDARSAVARVMAELAISPNPGHFAVLGMSAAAEVYVALLEAEARTGRASDATTRACARACRQLRRYARINPPAGARACLWQGCFDALGGRASQARAMWTACIALADRLALPYEAARAHSALGRSLGAADPAAAEHLDNAEQGFRAIDARFELARVDAARQREEGVAVVW